MYMAPLKHFSGCAVKWGKRTEKRGVLARVQPDQNKSRASPSLLVKYCENIAREKSERAPDFAIQYIEVSKVGEAWFPGPVLMGGIYFSHDFLVPNASNICKQGNSYFRGVLSSLDHRTRLPHLTPFFHSLNLVLPSTEWPTYHQDAGNRSCAIVTQKQLYWAHPAQGLKEMQLCFPLGPVVDWSIWRECLMALNHRYLEKSITTSLF